MNVQALRILLLISLFFIPLLGPYQDFGYEKIKVIFFILSTSLIGFIWLFTKPQLKWDLIKIASLVFILVLFATSSLGLDFRVSFLGTEPYFQGLALYAYLFLFSLMVSSLAIKLEHAALVLAGSSIIISLVAIQSWIMLNIFNIPVPTYAGRVVSTFGQPNFYAGFLLLVLPFAYFLLKNLNPGLQQLGWGSGLLSIVGILISYSRSAIFLSLILLSLGLMAQLKTKFKLGLIASGTIVILIALKLSAGTFGFVWNEFSQPTTTDNPDLTKVSVEKRAYLWPAVWQLVLQKPLLGYGMENINTAFSNYFTEKKHMLFEENLTVSPVLISLKELNIDRSHNYFLDLILFSGGIGLLVWIFLVVLLFLKVLSLKQAHHSYDINVLMVSLAVYLVWIQFQNQSIAHLVYFWLLIGIISRKSKKGY